MTTIITVRLPAPSGGLKVTYGMGECKVSWKGLVHGAVALECSLLARALLLSCLQLCKRPLRTSCTALSSDCSAMNCRWLWSNPISLPEQSACYHCCIFLAKVNRGDNLTDYSREFHSNLCLVFLYFFKQFWTVWIPMLVIEANGPWWNKMMFGCI